MSYNIIGDIAGQYKTLQALINKMPEGKIISVGDMIDRGPNSLEVIEYFMNNPNAQAILGNHEHMMVCKYLDIQIYDSGIWFYNGGRQTIKSLFPNNTTDCYQLVQKIPKQMIDWMRNLPLYLEIDNLFISHGPKNPGISLEKACDVWDRFSFIESTIIWYRYATKRNHPNYKEMQDKYQIFGHNSHWGLKRLTDKQGEYGICIDTSSEDVLTGLHYPSMQIYQQQYLD